MHPYIILLLLLETSVFQVPLINSSGKGSIWIEAKQFKYLSLTPYTNYVTTFHGCVVPGFTHSPVLNWQHFFCLSVMQKFWARIFKCLTSEIPRPDLSEVQSLCKCIWNWDSHESTWCLLVSLKKKLVFFYFSKFWGKWLKYLRDVISFMWCCTGMVVKSLPEAINLHSRSMCWSSWFAGWTSWFLLGRIPAVGTENMSMPLIFPSMEVFQGSHQ